MDRAITLGELGWIVIIIMVVLVGVWLIRALKALGDVLSRFDRTFRKHDANVDKVLNRLPDLVENVTVVASDVRDVTELLKEQQLVVDDALETIHGVIALVAETVRGLNDDVFSKVRGVFNLARVLLRGLIRRGWRKGDASDGGAGDSAAGAREGGAAEAERFHERVRRAQRRRTRVNRGRLKARKIKSGRRAVP